ncbi:MAG: VIT1/CCC1 transporter family protein [Acidothermus sp.]|nr:VIT1/CCC1 transporter family protein [Acidothermus sp.]MCL6538666.1 VIT1/CCC1 transporter family protein [Acidothermus sp.]
MTAERTSETGAGGVRAEIHHSHRDVTGGWLRPAVFGAMDGIISNVSLIAGFVGAQASPHLIILSGLGGLIAGAFSMGVGEYVSVASQGDLARAEIEVEREELLRNAHAEREELAQLYVARGLDPELAREVARQLSRDPDRALEIHAREELGLAPGELPSPLLAAGSSFLSFSIGAFVPLLPFLLGAVSFWPAIVLTAVALFVAGAVVARITARPWWFGGLRQLAFGAAAAAVTYGVGAAIGVHVA